MCFKGNQLDKAWKLVVAATVWNIWLARNDILFAGKQLSKESLQALIHIRVGKWGKAANTMNFGNDPLWITKPHCAIVFRVLTIQV